MRRRPYVVILFLALVMSPLTIAAQEASPAASLGTAACEAPALPPGTPTPLEELFPEATPADDMADMDMASPPANFEVSTPAVTDVPEVDPADEEATARVTAAVENIVECLNAGDAEAFAALTTPAYLEYSFGITNPYDVIYVLEGYPPVELLSVENVLVHPDGRFSAEVTQVLGGTQVDHFRAIFVDAGDYLLLDEENPLPIENADMTVKVSMVDFAFEMSESTIPSDALVAFNVTNNGQYPHEFAVVQLPEGMTVDDVLEEPALVEEVVFLGGVFAEPGQSAFFALDSLQPGAYTVVCFVDVPEGIPHVVRGMVTELTVE